MLSVNQPKTKMISLSTITTSILILFRDLRSACVKIEETLDSENLLLLYRKPHQIYLTKNKALNIVTNPNVKKEVMCGSK
jgi:hypothetical protein